MRACLVAGLVLASLSWSVVVRSQTQEWTRFRGPNGTGLSAATTVPTTWTESDYNWKVQLPGVGHSSPVLWGDKLFITSAIEETAQRIILCLNAHDGRIEWQRRYDSTVHHHHKFNSFASTTPALDAQHVYVCWSTPEEYTLLALDHSGKEVWKINLGPFVSQHSCGTSPIVYEDMVVLGNDQDGTSFLRAVSCKDGSTVWQCDRRSAVVAYSTPCVHIGADGKPELIFNSEAHGISGIDPVTGKTNWELAVFDKRSCSSPVCGAGLVFGTCGSGGGGSYVVALRPGPKPEIAYKITDAAPYVPSLLIKDNLLFLWSDKGIVSAYVVGTGEKLWSSRVGGNFFGSPVCVGDHLYCIDEEGQVVVVKAADKFELVAKNPLGEPSRATPAVAGGRMYLRTYSHLVSLGGKK